MIQQKKAMSGWMWVLIVVILIAIGIGLYVWLSGGSGGGNSLISGGGSVPQPPALPS